MSQMKNGGIEVDVAPDWPEGAPDCIERQSCADRYDDERPETPEEIEASIQRLRAIDALELTPEEEAAWTAALREQKEYEIANTAKREKRIAEIFE